MAFKSTDRCLAKVAEDEPIFVLRAQDKLAPALVSLWSELAELNGCPREKVSEAFDLSVQMRRWGREHRSKFPD